MTDKPRRARKAIKWASHWEWFCKTCQKTGGIERAGGVRTKKQYQAVVDAAYNDHNGTSHCRSGELEITKVDGNIG